MNSPMEATQTSYYSPLPGHLRRLGAAGTRGLCLAIALGLGGLSGCKGEASPAPASSAAANVPVEAPAANAAQPYAVKLEAVGAYRVGEQGQARVVLTPKAPFHCNQDYPYKLKLDPSSGLSFASDTLTKEQAHITADVATLDVAFTPKSAGPHTLSGTFSFSVCKDDQCLVDRQQLSLELVAAAP